MIRRLFTLLSVGRTRCTPGTGSRSGWWDDGPPRRPEGTEPVPTAPRAPTSSNRGRAALAAAALLCLGGCHYQRVTVSVLDAESGAPVADGEVQTRHSKQELGPDVWESRDRVVGGSARVAVVDGYGPEVRATAPGYLPAGEGVNSWPHLAATDPTVVVRVYREPAPRIVLELPDGYTGLVKVGLSLLEYGDNPYPPGQRVFPLPYVPPGIAWLPATPLLWRTSDRAGTQQFEAVYRRSRTPVPAVYPPRDRHDVPALRYLRRYTPPELVGGRGVVVYFFFVGTVRAMGEAVGRHSPSISDQVPLSELEAFEFTAVLFEPGAGPVGPARPAGTPPPRSP